MHMLLCCRVSPWEEPIVLVVDLVKQQLLVVFQNAAPTSVYRVDIVHMGLLSKSQIERHLIKLLRSLPFLIYGSLR